MRTNISLLSLALCFSTAIPFSFADDISNLSSSIIEGKRHGAVSDSNNAYNLYSQKPSDMGMLLPDVNNNYIWSSAGPRPGLNPELIEAQELKLKVRELASQLLDVYPGTGIQGLVALPTSFVSLDNFTETVPLGRYFAEALFYEFNLRGFPIQEYRLNNTISINANGEFALTRDIPKISYNKPWAALVVGTYYRDEKAVFINARLVKPDGMVLRTAQLILPMNGIVDRMTAKPPLSTGTLAIKGK